MSCPFIRTLIRHEVLESTNDLAKQLAVEGHWDLPLAVRADRQTRGRGRGAHTWWSDLGSLTFSLLVDPAAHGLRPRQEPRLALASAVAIIEAISSLFQTASAPGIRWPNDVEAGGRKLGGLLPERVNTPSGPRLVIGIGLNVLTRMADAPDELRRMAVSLADLCDGPLSPKDREAFFRAILEQFESVLAQLARDDPALASRWDQLDTLRGQRVRVNLGPRIVEGEGRGIDAEGALLLAGEQETFRLFGGQVLRE
jgi:BirA family transcriptional regulator, biotin operon repressor / biotin---[acetyl-CoA-carboxylase] ligase